MDYFNDSAMFPQTGFHPTAGLGGAISGMETGIGLDQLNRKKMMQDLDMQRQQMELSRNLKEEETVGDARRQAELSKFQNQSALAPSEFAAAQSKANTQIDSDKLKTSINHLSQMNAQNEWAYGVDQTNAGNPPPPDQWPSIQKQAQSLGVDLPNDPISATAIINKMAQQHANTGDMAKQALQHLYRQQEQQEHWDALKQMVERRADATENAAETRAGATLGAAQTRASVAGSKPLTLSQIRAQLEQRFMNGETLNDTEKAILAEPSFEKAAGRTSRDPTIQLQDLQADTPEKKAAAAQARDEAVQKNMSPLGQAITGKTAAPKVKVTEDQIQAFMKRGYTRAEVYSKIKQQAPEAILP